MVITNVPIALSKTNNDWQYRLHIEEDINKADNTSTLKIYLQFKADISNSPQKDVQYVLTINGNELFNRTTSRYFNNREEWNNVADFTREVTLSHDANGAGSYSIACTLKVGKLLGSWQTVGSASETVDYTEINRSAPDVTIISSGVDRFGNNGSIVFFLAHEYGIEQAYITILETDHYRNLYNVRNDESITFNFSGLVSGAAYQYLISAKAKETSIQSTFYGTLIVPQKVEGIRADSFLPIIVGNQKQIDWSVTPATSEINTASFESSDPEIATVNSNGVVTGVSIGVATITATTTDGGFSATIIVEVDSEERFPHLNNIDVLTASGVIKIQAAALFLAEIVDVSLQPISVPCETAVTSIKAVFEALESNCQTLKRATQEIYPTEHLNSSNTITKQNTNWHSVVNEWINFLNELNDTIISEELL